MERWGLTALGLLGIAVPAALPAASGDLFSLSLEQLSQVPVAVATGTPKPLAGSPAATTLLLPEDFRAMGAVTVDDALVAVPGLHVSRDSGFAGTSRYFIRGIASNASAEVLVLLNGLPVNTMVQNNSVPPLQGGMPIELVKRLEVIRGPGSAIYGADAFAGVINIITVDAADVPGTRASVSAGSFDTQRALLSHSGRIAGAAAVAMLGYRRSDGDGGRVEADAQSASDAAMGTQASLAPGPLQRRYQHLDGYARLQWGQVDLHGLWQEVRDYGAHQGLAGALDPYGSFDLRRVGLDGGWHGAPAAGWELEARLGAMHNSLQNREPFRTFPSGAFGNDPGSGQPLFPAGLQDAFDLNENNAHAQLSAVWHGWDGHRLRFGTGLSWNDQYKTTTRRNYTLTGPGQPPAPLPGGLTDVSDTPAVFVPENQRVGEFLFVQDEWRLAAPLELTAGLRHDHYSDVGGVTTPRLALVWTPSPRVTAKLIYGEAFRAPSFSELYVTSNPFALGNPGLAPERLRSTEARLSVTPAARWQWHAGVFRYDIRDFINFVPVGGGFLEAANTGRYRGEGGTFEVNYRHDGWQVLAHVSGQQVENVSSGDDLGGAPEWRAYLRASAKPAPRWQVSGQVNVVGPRARVEADPRPDLAGYTSVDATLRYRLPPRAELYLTASNLFDADMREPGIGLLPESLPGPGPGLMLGLDLAW